MKDKYDLYLHGCWVCLMSLKQLLPVWASRRTEWDGSSARTERALHSCPLKTLRRGTLTPRNKSANREACRHKCVHEQKEEKYRLNVHKGCIRRVLARPPAGSELWRAAHPMAYWLLSCSSLFKRGRDTLLQKQRLPLVQTCYITTHQAMQAAAK